MRAGREFKTHSVEKRIMGAGEILPLKLGESRNIQILESRNLVQYFVTVYAHLRVFSLSPADAAHT